MHSHKEIKADMASDAIKAFADVNPAALIPPETWTRFEPGTRKLSTGDTLKQTEQEQQLDMLNGYILDIQPKVGAWCVKKSDGTTLPTANGQPQHMEPEAFADSAGHKVSPKLDAETKQALSFDCRVRLLLDDHKQTPAGVILLTDGEKDIELTDGTEVRFDKTGIQQVSRDALVDVIKPAIEQLNEFRTQAFEYLRSKAQEEMKQLGADNK